VLTRIKSGIRECTERLDTLGALRATAQEQRRYLLHVSQFFSTLVRAAIDGQYSDPFFGDVSTTEGYCREPFPCWLAPTARHAPGPPIGQLTSARRLATSCILALVARTTYNITLLIRYQRRFAYCTAKHIDRSCGRCAQEGPHTYTIVDERPTKLPHNISRSDYIAKVTKILEGSRGGELPGTFDRLIIGQYFHEQRRPWAVLVD
jgi:hypothetical protein